MSNKRKNMHQMHNDLADKIRRNLHPRYYISIWECFECAKCFGSLENSGTCTRCGNSDTLRFNSPGSPNVPDEDLN